MEHRSTPWPWVAVALVLAVAAVMITLIIVRGKGGSSASTARVVDAPLRHRRRKRVVHTTVHTVTAPATVTESATAPAGSPTGLRSCDQNISVNSATSCPFADNVFAAYANDVQSAGSPGSYQLYNIYSPSTGDSYSDTCNYNPSTQIVLCSHGSDLVQFPEWAAAVYNG
jgi:hypothetical protein